MDKRIVAEALILASMSALSGEASGVLDSAADLARACVARQGGVAFAITARVDAVELDVNGRFYSAYVSDATGFATLAMTNAADQAGVAPGCVMAAEGFVDVLRVHVGRACVRSLRVISAGPPPTTRLLTGAQVMNPDFDFAWGEFSGTVTDAFVDELDDRFAYFMLRDENEEVIATCPVAEGQRADLPKFIGATVRGLGYVAPRFPSYRGLIGRGFACYPTGGRVGLNALEIVRPAPSNPFLIAGRTRFSGVVVAVWQGTHALVVSGPWPAIHRVDFAQGQPLPAYGEKVQVAGERRTDSYCWNLVRAIWCPNPGVPWTPTPARETTAEEILANGRRSPHGINPQWHGRLVRICGHVVGVSYERGVATLQCEHETVSVDVSASLGALDALREGATVAVTGTVVFDVPNWRRGEPFPRIRGMTLVPRGVNDVTVLSAPPWWTPTRILLLAALVVLVLAGFGLRERIRKRLAQMRVAERTKLAIELHDSVTQTLSAAGLQLDAAIRVAEKSGDQPVAGVLRTAAQTLSSSLMELRNCLWDLRNRALDLPDFATAIRKTVEPHLKGAALHVRFAVPRRDLADDVAHAVLQMIRELVSNAVRHGQAKTIRIAGAVDANGASRRLLFSVANDGAGFDLDAVPGVGAGHFGLQGLRERVRRFGGRLRIESRPPVKVSVELPMEGGNG